MNAYNGFSGAQRTRALDWLNREYGAGRRQRPTLCDLCGQDEGLIQAHSEDYSGPPFGDNIGYFALCYICHMMIHCRFRNPRAWSDYRRLLSEGLVLARPGPKADWGAVVRFLNGGRPPFRPSRHPRSPVGIELLQQLDLAIRGV